MFLGCGSFLVLFFFFLVCLETLLESCFGKEGFGVGEIEMGWVDPLDNLGWGVDGHEPWGCEERVWKKARMGEDVSSLVLDGLATEPIDSPQVLRIQESKECPVLFDMDELLPLGAEIFGGWEQSLVPFDIGTGGGFPGSPIDRGQQTEQPSSGGQNKTRGEKSLCLGRKENTKKKGRNNAFEDECSSATSSLGSYRRRASMASPTQPGLRSASEENREVANLSGKAVDKTHSSISVPDTKEEGDGSLSPTKETETANKGGNGRRTYGTSASPSLFCHICGRKETEFVVCKNNETKLCRKIFCFKCDERFTLGIRQAMSTPAGFECLHCRKECPSVARCNFYHKSTEKRRLIRMLDNFARNSMEPSK